MDRTFKILFSLLSFRAASVYPHDGADCSRYSGWFNEQCDGCGPAHKRNDITAWTDNCNHCEEGKYQDQAVWTHTYCNWWSNCNAGQYVSTAPSNSNNRGCTTCPSGTFTTSSNVNVCSNKQNCAAGYYVVSEGSTSSDRSCSSCPTGRFSTTANAGSCNYWHTCITNEYVDPSNPGSTTADRNCLVCGAGTESTTNNANTCTDIDGCVSGLSQCRSEGDTGATCDDVVAPGTGHTCDCTSGYHEQAGVCVNQEECLANSCRGEDDQNATCIDLAPPLEGFVCDCSAGFTPIGSECVDVDECETNVCAGHGDTGSLCENKTAPESGNTCQCTSGYESVVENGVEVCKNIDSCVSNPCDDEGDANAYCYDADPPSTSYQCTCTQGFTFESGTCRQQDDCEVNRCASNGDSTAVCHDLTAPSVGNTCECSPGYEAVYEGGTENTTTCENIDSCASNPCTTNGDEDAACVDFVPPLDGYRCVCSDGYEHDNSTCSDTDSCADDPCRADGDVNATCFDNEPGHAFTHECNCTSLFVSDLNGTHCVTPETAVESLSFMEENQTMLLVGGAGALVFALVIVYVVYRYRRMMMAKSQKMDTVLKRAENELCHRRELHEFNEFIELGEMTCDLPIDGDLDASTDLRHKQKELEEINRRLREDNMRHKHAIEKHELEREDNGDSTVVVPMHMLAFGEERMGDDISMGTTDGGDPYL